VQNGPLNTALKGIGADLFFAAPHLPHAVRVVQKREGFGVENQPIVLLQKKACVLGGLGLGVVFFGRFANEDLLAQRPPNARELDGAEHGPVP
jgi:hypothetical protein